ncbi:hypothetical protein CHBNV3_18590 [Haemophilus influenzae]|uniref:surface lipoprotein assembly modifier n=1 Tax=Haemophilus influenzae TaxID=727 RepID=UPI0006834AE2|nr:surface lipoprotein assembly modifier [Haemophilus influenzae]KMZ19771.1 chromosomal replication initiation protein [Haemophilus influenzae]MCK9029251.1 surface lipoprotein assembly modifier [Haemophilus influenzae]BBF16856.1 hypothetical protein CHBNV3_18590 [Haemophilus influenzae]
MKNGVKQISLLSLIGLSLTNIAWAEVARPKNDTLTNTIQSAELKTSSFSSMPKKEIPNRHIISLSKSQLAQHPRLVLRGLIPALYQNNTQAVQLLLPLYKQFPQQDNFLLTWAKAIEAREQGDLTQSIAYYRELFARNASLLPLRYQLAQALFFNYENEAAKIQFEKLRTEVDDEKFLGVIDQYLLTLNQRNQWIWQVGLNFLNDDNLNNAPKSGTKIGSNWTAWEKESGQGVGYSLSVEKKWPWADHFFSKTMFNGNGKYYWDNKKYNEATVRIGGGLGYQTASVEVSLFPFKEKRWYAGGSSGTNTMKQYADKLGIRLEMIDWLSKTWQISTALEYGKSRYKTRKHLDGDYYFISSTLFYLPKSTQFWFVGMDFHRENTQALDNAYQQKALRFGWGQDWSYGISSRFTFSYANRAYREKDLIGIQQKNREYTTTITLWHRNIHFMGLTPKLSWDYQKSTSNHAFYRYDKNRIYLEIGKIF